MDDTLDKESAERLSEQSFGPLIDAEPEQLAAALVSSTRRDTEDLPATPRD